MEAPEGVAACARQRGNVANDGTARQCKSGSKWSMSALVLRDTTQTGCSNTSIHSRNLVQ